MNIIHLDIINGQMGGVFSSNQWIIYRRDIDSDKYGNEPVMSFPIDIEESLMVSQVKHWFYAFMNGGTFTNCKALYLYWGNWRYAKIILDTDGNQSTIQFRNEEYRQIFQKYDEKIPEGRWGHQTTMLGHKWFELIDDIQPYEIKYRKKGFIDKTPGESSDTDCDADDECTEEGEQTYY